MKFHFPTGRERNCCPVKKCPLSRNIMHRCVHVDRLAVIAFLISENASFYSPFMGTSNSGTGLTLSSLQKKKGVVARLKNTLVILVDHSANWERKRDAAIRNELSLMGHGDQPLIFLHFLLPFLPSFRLSFPRAFLSSPFFPTASINLINYISLNYPRE